MLKQRRNSLGKRAVCFSLVVALLLGVLPAAGATSVENVRVASAPLTSRAAPTNGMVRVYLSSLGDPTALNLTVVGNYSLSLNGKFIPNGSELTVGFNKSTGAITLTQNGVKTNMGMSFSLRRHSASGVNGIKIRQARESGNPYPGDLSFKAVKSGGGYTLQTIAHIYIENYLYGVLPYEMGNSTGIEALKAQAVAARTYTVRMMQNRASGSYDVKDTTSDQVYRGTPSGNANCVSAVDSTKGIVLMYGSEYITTYYSASNGGQTETARTGTAHAYMKVKDDPFDFANPNSVVKKKTISADLNSSSNPSGLMSLLKTKAVSKLAAQGKGATAANTTLVTLKSVTPHTPKYASPSRLYGKMDFTLTAKTNGATNTVTVTCDIFSELEGLLGMGIQSMANELWSVSKTGSGFTLEARRYGHGMGLSQRGAMYMAKLGYRYEQILGFYYDGCKRVQHSFTSSILSADSGDQQITVEPPADLEGEDENACKGTVHLVSAKATLAIRNGKSTSAAVIGSAGNGAIVDVLANDGTWSFIRFGQLKGYVPTNALVISGTPAGGEETATSVIGFATVTASDFVNLRAEGSMSAKVLTTAPGGAVLTVFSVNGSWAKVQYNATVAYANTGFLSAVSATYPGDTSASGNSVATVNVAGENGSVNLRATPSMLSQVLAQLPHGTQLSVTSDDGSWSCVTWQGVSGYVLSEYLSYTGEGTVPDGGDMPPEPDESDPPSESEGGDPETPDGEQPETPDESDKRYAKVTTEYGALNMRAQARAGSPIVTTIPQYARVEVMAYGDIWCGVRYNGYMGFAMTCFLTLENGSPEDAQPPQQSGTATVTTQSGTLNLRAMPRTGSEILLRIPQYAAVTVLERGAQWSQVTYQGITGYVMTVFLTFSTGEADAQPTPPPETDDDDRPEALPPETDDGNDETVTPPPETENAVYATVTTVSGALNMRRDALPGSPVLVRIPKGTTIVIRERLAAWSRITYGGQTGYVMNAYLTFLDGKPDGSEGETAVVTTASGSLNMRLEPSREAGVLARIPQYATVNVQKRGADWCCVSYNGMLGYVMTSFLTFDDSKPPETENIGDESVTPPIQPPEQQIEAAYVDTPSGSLNLREQAGESYRVLMTIPRGAAVQVLLRGGKWCQVQYDGCMGYVMTKFLRFETPASTEPPAETEPPHVEEPSEGEETPPSEDTAPDEESAVTAWVLTDSGSLNLRNAPNGSEILANIPRLAALKLLEEGNTWSLVSYNGLRGYVMTRFLTVNDPTAGVTEAETPPPEKIPAEEQPTDENGSENAGGTQEELQEEASSEAAQDPTLQTPEKRTFAVRAEGVDALQLWFACEKTGAPLASVPQNEQVEVLQLGENWCLVQFENMNGYCLTNELEVIADEQ